jgi:hypothetical protein
MKPELDIDENRLLKRVIFIILASFATNPNPEKPNNQLRRSYADIIKHKHDNPSRINPCLPLVQEPGLC